MAHFGGREEIQLNPLTATRVSMFPEDPGLRAAYALSSTVKVVHAREDRMLDCIPHFSILRCQFYSTIGLQYNTLAHSIVYELRVQKQKTYL